MSEKTTNVMNRIEGIDLLRIVATLMIVTLHVLAYGGILRNDLDGLQPIIWFVYIIAFCGVDCYGIISGYVGYDSKFKISRLVKFWTQIIIYTVLETTLFYIFEPDLISKSNWLNAIFPIIRQEYWYMTAYFILYFLMPMINRFIKNSKEMIIKIVLAFMLLCYTTIKCVFKLDIWGSNVILLVILYLLGAYVKKTKLCEKIKNIYPIIIFFIMIIGTFCTRLINCYMFIKNDSPSIIFAAFGLFIIFYKVRINIMIKKLINFFAPTTLGVYLIHTNRLVLDYLIGKITNMFVLSVSGNILVKLIMLILLVLGIFLICSLIDQIRYKIMSLYKPVNNKIMKNRT